MAQAVERILGKDEVGGSIPPSSSKKALAKASAFLSIAKAMVYHPPQAVYHRGRQSRPRISSRASVYIFFRNDYIQSFALMIYNSCGIDDIQPLRADDMQGSALMETLTSTPTRLLVLQTLHRAYQRTGKSPRNQVRGGPSLLSAAELCVFRFFRCRFHL